MQWLLKQKKKLNFKKKQDKHYQIEQKLSSFDKFNKHYKIISYFIYNTDFLIVKIINIYFKNSFVT
jgi:ornithine cyclodeaminase/alanine dehydrogenase-like protein (mu-crystallin family)